ncbi:unnamed protein product [Urochloa humidicola]
MNSALMLNEQDQQMSLENNYTYVLTHDVSYWGLSLDHDLQMASKYHASMNTFCIGSSINFCPILVKPNFQKLLPGDINPSYNRTCNRLVLLDYYTPMLLSQEIIDIVNKLCSDLKNTVFLISGWRKEEVAAWFAPCEMLRIAVEHGYLTRWSSDSPWESSNLVTDFPWKSIVKPVMKHYSDATDGSYIEEKETSVVWQYSEANPEFGSC